MPSLPTPPQEAFSPPAKMIQDADGLKKFLGGSSVKSFVAFILSLNQAVVGEQPGGGGSAEC